jgi:hypothetical protein
MRSWRLGEGDELHDVRRRLDVGCGQRATTDERRAVAVQREEAMAKQLHT